MEHVEAERDVGTRLDRLRHADLTCAADQRRGEQDARDVLRGDVAGKLEHARCELAGNRERKGAVRIDGGAVRAERGDERSERTFREPGGAGEARASDRCCHGKEESQRRPGLTAIEDPRGIVPALEGFDREARAIADDPRPERFEAADRGIDIVGRCGADDARGRIGERGADEGAVSLGFRGDGADGARQRTRIHERVHAPIPSSMMRSNPYIETCFRTGEPTLSGMASVMPVPSAFLSRRANPIRSSAG